MEDMIIGVFEVYSENRNDCIIFLTEQEAKDQNILSPSEGPYPANVKMSAEEYQSLKKDRFLWA